MYKYDPPKRISEAKSSFEQHLVRHAKTDCLCWIHESKIFTFEGRRFVPRRYMFELTIGMVPEGLTVARCKEMPGYCVDPEHTGLWDPIARAALITHPALPEAAANHVQGTELRSIFRLTARHMGTNCLLWLERTEGAAHRAPPAPRKFLYGAFLGGLPPGAVDVPCRKHALCIEPTHTTLTYPEPLEVRRARHDQERADRLAAQKPMRHLGLVP